MSIRAVLVSLSLLPLLACDPTIPVDTGDDGIPCEEIWTSDHWPERIDLYAWNGSDVYLTDFGCCDRFIEVYDLQCNYLCAPEGGLTAGGDGRCPDFHDDATYLDTLYPE